MHVVVAVVAKHHHICLVHKTELLSDLFVQEPLVV